MLRSNLGRGVYHAGLFGGLMLLWVGTQAAKPPPPSPPPPSTGSSFAKAYSGAIFSNGDLSAVNDSFSYVADSLVLTSAPLAATTECPAARR